jgi:Asp-tRNA(Asn)/Glu-tRNA(Gln) amidotransferase A subunit family amidase
MKFSAKQILDMDATAVLAAYRKKKLKPSEAVETYIAHQRRFNPRLNLVVERRYDQARIEAAACDKLLAKGKITGKLFGVPISMKESFEVAGMHTTGGLLHLHERKSSIDAAAVKMLRDEGAIILCKTNTPALCFYQETDNLLFGRSNNPHNPEYTTGGSSGGEAALIAAGGAAAGFGSDIGGSIRIPAHFNGVVGFKAGARQFPDAGHMPEVTLENQIHMLGFGPIVKSVRDAALLYSIVHPEFKPPTVQKIPAKLKVVSFSDFHNTVCSPETKETVDAAQQALKRQGALLNREVPEFMKDVAEVWQLTMSEDRGQGINSLAYPGRPKAFLIDNLRARLGLKTKNPAHLSWAIMGTNLFPPNEKQRQWITDFRSEGMVKIKELLGNNGVFVTPAYPTPAKKHNEVYNEIFAISKTFRWVLPFICLPNTFGLPAMIVPSAFSDDGLPIGLQVTGLPGSEQTIFKVAMLLEKQLGGYQRCQDYD